MEGIPEHKKHIPTENQQKKALQGFAKHKGMTYLLFVPMTFSGEFYDQVSDRQNIRHTK
jgi:hypothetical protein